ncbi:MAG: YeiH family protein [Rhodospirillales bacterium]
MTAAATPPKQTKAGPPASPFLRPFVLVRDGWRGLLIAVLIAATSAFVSDHYGGPAVLFALLIGLACSFLRDDDRIRPGLDLASRFVLRLGVALRGARLAATQDAELGDAPSVRVVAAMAATFAVARATARLFGFTRDFALLSATATGVCGVSAALTAASILPRRPGSDRDTAFVALGVTLLSTVAMVLYPILADRMLGSDLAAGVFVGASIHDVAQVVAAGYLISVPAGDAAVVTKLARVAMLVPVSILLSIHVATRADAAVGGEPLGRRIRRCLSLPWFLVLFIVLAVLNSVSVLPPGSGDVAGVASRACLVVAIAAIGVKTGVKQMVDMGWRASLFLVLLTLTIAVAAGSGVLLAGH